MKERWKNIDGYDGGYQVSNKGRIRSYNCHWGRRKKPIIMSTTINHCGYPMIGFSKNNKKKLESVHRLVAKAFIPNPENKPEVNHKDGDKTNNKVSNIEWVTKEENTNHAIENGLTPRGENHHNSKLTREEVLEIRNAYRLGCFSHTELAEAYGVGNSAIYEIVNCITWKHI